MQTAGAEHNVRRKEDAYVADVNNIKVFAAKLNLMIL
jgi:hypothetical protein